MHRVEMNQKSSDYEVAAEEGGEEERGRKRQEGQRKRERETDRENEGGRGGTPRLPEEVISVASKSVSPDVRKLPDAPAEPAFHLLQSASPLNQRVEARARRLHRGRISPLRDFFFSLIPPRDQSIRPAASNARSPPCPSDFPFAIFTPLRPPSSR